jgi:hypothetical protein
MLLHGGKEEGVMRTIAEFQSKRGYAAALSDFESFGHVVATHGAPSEAWRQGYREAARDLVDQYGWQVSPWKASAL